MAYKTYKLKSGGTATRYISNDSSNSSSSSSSTTSSSNSSKSSSSTGSSSSSNSTPVKAGDVVVGKTLTQKEANKINQSRQTSIIKSSINSSSD